MELVCAKSDVTTKRIGVNEYDAEMKTSLSSGAGLWMTCHVALNGARLGILPPGRDAVDALVTATGAHSGCGSCLGAVRHTNALDVNTD